MTIDMSSPKFTVAICGGGIAGLTAAIALSRFSSERKDVRIDVYEAAQAFTEIGAGVGMMRRPWRIMKALGADLELRKLVDVPESEDKEVTSFTLRKSDQQDGVSFYDLKSQMGILTFHRAEYQRVLAGQLDPTTTTAHFHKRLVSYSYTDTPFSALSTSTSAGPITLHFKDGTIAQCDVLIGADGIHSATRHTLLGLAARDLETESVDEDDASRVKRTMEADELRRKVNPVWSGTIAYRGLVRRERMDSVNPGHRALRSPLIYMGKNKHIIAYPISLGRFINVAAFCSWPEKEGTVFEGNMVEEVPREELIEQFEDWEEDVLQLMSCIEKTSRWAINTVEALPKCTHDRVALIGDAAHAMMPHQGAGAGQAIEDAYVLGAILAHALTTRTTLPAALTIYEAARLPRARDVQRRSRTNGGLFAFTDPRIADLSVNWRLGLNAKVEEAEARMRLRAIGDAVSDNWRWAWETKLEDDCEQAIRTLEDELRGRQMKVEL